MANISYSLDQNATVEKILNGDMPNGVAPDDNVILITEDVLRIYTHLLAGLLFRTLPEKASDELVDKRTKVFDDVMECINAYRCGRLHRLIEKLNDAMKDHQVDTSAWPNTKMRNNVFSFINDFWIWNEQERSELLVVVEVDLDKVQQQLVHPVDSDDVEHVEGEIVTE